MNVSHVSIPFEKIEEVLDLPDGAKIVAAREHENGRFIVVRVIANSPPVNFELKSGDPLSKIGDAYRGSLPEEVPPPIEPEVVEDKQELYI